MVRDARINQIGEGSNEVLTSFIALVGMRGPGMEFKEIYDTMLRPSRAGIGRAWTAGMHRLGAAVRIPDVPVRSNELRSFANQLGRLIWRFNLAVNRSLIAYREPILDLQLVQERIANAAMDLFASTCVLSRWDSELQAAQRNGETAPAQLAAPDLFLRQSSRRIRQFLGGLTGNGGRRPRQSLVMAVLAGTSRCGVRPAPRFCPASARQETRRICPSRTREGRHGKWFKRSHGPFRLRWSHPLSPFSFRA
jgi:hypothetical protein